MALAKVKMATGQLKSGTHQTLKDKKSTRIGEVRLREDAKGTKKTELVTLGQIESEPGIKNG